MAITEATNVCAYSTVSTTVSGTVRTCYYRTEYETLDCVEFVITTTHSDNGYIYFEPKEFVDWRGLEKCFTGFKSNYKLNSSARYTIRQPSKDHRNVRRMRIQSLRSKL